MGCNSGIFCLILLINCFIEAECFVQENNTWVLYPAFILGIHMPLVIIATLLYWVIHSNSRSCLTRKRTNATAPAQGGMPPPGPLPGPSGALAGHSMANEQVLRTPSEHHLTNITGVAYAVKVLVHNLWKPEEVVRMGRDAPITDKKYINIKKVEVNKFTPLMIRYNEKMKTFKTKLSMIKEMKPLPKLNRSEIQTTELLSRFRVGYEMMKLLALDLNEHYLFHGTKRANVDSICKNGLVVQKAAEGMFGTGIYFAENPTKADQYTDTDGGEQVMFLMRVCLGELYIHSGKNANHLKEPPCRNCRQHACKKHRFTFDSAVAGFDMRFREFIVYNNYRAFPEYMITYERTYDKREMKEYICRP